MSTKSADFLEEDDDSSLPPGKKVGKKKHYPFGTPSHMRHPYSFFAHLKLDNKAFAADLATATNIEAEVIEVKPKRFRRPKTTTSSKSGGDGEDQASAVDPMDVIPPTTEGLEPCTKILCQQVIRGILDIQYKNQIEREEIEDEYQRLLQDLEAAEADIVSAEEKLVTLNEIGNQLEQRHNQLILNVKTLEATREQLQNERSDVNNKIMVTETERQKCNRKLEKAEKALAEAMWHKKKKQQKENADAGLSLGGSIISEQPIKQSDANTIASADSAYHTSYARLSQTKVVDISEQPPQVFTLPHYVTERLETMPHHFDKYAKRHYKQMAKHGVESWKGMEGSCLTAALGSSSTKGPDEEHTVASYREYTAGLKSIKNLQADLAIELGRRASNSATANRVSALLQSRNLRSGMNLSKSIGSLSPSQLSSSLGSSQKSIRTKSRSKSNNVRLQPLHGNGTPNRVPQASGLDAGDSFDSLPGGQPSVVSALSAAGVSAAGGSIEEDDNARKLDPVFYNDKARAMWGRNKKVGKMRKTDIVWGMESYTGDGRKKSTENEEKQSKSQSVKRNARFKSEYAPPPTVKTRSLTIYHPDMEVFQDAFQLKVEQEQEVDS